MNGQGAVLDDDIGPEPGPERLVRDQPAAGLGQEKQDLPGLCRNPDVPAIARQPTLGSIEDKRTKRIDWSSCPFIHPALSNLDPFLTC